MTNPSTGVWKIPLFAAFGVLVMASSAFVAEEPQFASKIGDNVEPMQMVTTNRLDILST